MRALITGATGFLGRHLIEKLHKEGCEIVALIRPSSEIDHLQQFNVQFVYGDLRDEECISKALQNVDVVIHSAATMRGAWEDYHRVNVKSTELLLEQCRKVKVKRFIFISSVIVYDHTHSQPGTTLTEDLSYETDNLTNYSRSKIEAEKVVSKYHKEFGLPTVILRPAALYGSGGPIYPARLGFSAGSNLYLMIGDGKQTLPLSHVRSVTEAAWAAIGTEQANGKIYNIVEGGSITQSAFLNRVKAIANPKLKVLTLPYGIAKFLAVMLAKMLSLLGQTSPIRLPYLRLCSNQFYYSNQRAKKELNWQPQNDFEKGIDVVLEEFAQQRKPKREVPLRRGKVVVPTKQKLNVGMVGSGMFAETHLSILRKFRNANIVALCDPNREAREKMAQKFNISKTYSDIQQMLKNEKIDVVHIVTPAQSHYELAVAAMKHKCHVLLEKPMTLNTQDAKKLIKLAKEHGVKLTVDHNHLFDEVMIKAREMIAKGAVGNVAYVESWYATSYSSNRNSKYLHYDARKHWVYHLPGALYQNMISHPISLLTDVMGEVHDLKAAAKYMHIVPHMQNDELRVLFENKKMMGSVHMSLTISPRYHFVNIYGTNGTLKIDLLNKFIFFDKVIPMAPKVISRNLMMLKYATAMLWAMLRNGFNLLRGKYSLFEGNERLIHLFYRSILLGEPVPVSSQEARHSMEIMDKIWEQIEGPGLKNGRDSQVNVTKKKTARRSAKKADHRSELNA